MITITNLTTLNKDLKNILDDANLLIAGRFYCELLEILSSSTDSSEQVHACHAWLDKNIDLKLLGSSHDQKVVYVWDEVITPELVILLHNWFRMQMCNITNVVLISTHTTNLSKWYNSYCKLFNQNKMSIVDAPWAFTIYSEEIFKSFESVPSTYTKQECQYYFDFYGGFRNTQQRDFQTAAFATIAELGYIEYGAGYCDNYNFDGYLEEISGFVDASMCDKINKAKHSVILQRTVEPKLKVQTNHVKTGNKCAFKIITETSCHTPFNVVTEKTLKGIFEMRVLLPLGYRSISELEKFGFILDWGLFDMSYQNEPLYFKRIITAITEIKRLSLQYTLTEFSGVIYNECKSKLEYN
jgi:hypothetical protein